MSMMGNIAVKVACEDIQRQMRKYEEDISDSKTRWELIKRYIENIQKAAEEGWY